ncbi:uncharacterized protein LOC128043022 [Gossypium raimondii]|uniref:uncharacterized protein LOC128043022 n=1 Tax=Gossypium raimondii TaxID=29730 RepID=UPI00227BA297|nr:uncharacterized protein LOC128043022 [Gossypium raimondii]
MSYRELYQNLFDAHIVSPYYLKPLQPPYPKWYDANAQCNYHAGVVGHSIEHCTALKKLVERLIGMGVVKLDDLPNIENPLPNHNDNGMNMIGGNMGRKIKKDTAEVKIPLRWVWNKMVERVLFVLDSERSFGGVKNYCEFYHEEGHEIQECIEFRALVQGMMDDKEVEFYEEVKEEGSICASEPMKVPKVTHPVVIISRPKNDEEIIEDQGIGAYPEPVKGRAITVEQKKGKIAEPVLFINEPVKEEEAVEFFTFLKHSEYNVVEQLHKQSARISVLALLLNSEVHRSALMKVLKETYVANDISVSKLDWLANNIRVLIDNGSTLNVLPLSTLNRLPIDSSHMKTCQNIVRAFNGTERKVMGRIEIPLLIGPIVYEKLKLLSEGRLVKINPKEDIIATVSSEAPYVETNDESVECSFRSLEFVNATFFLEGSKILVPKISKTTEMGLQLLVGKGALPRRGLGKYLQGKIEVPVLKEKQDNFGLGYKPDRGQRKKELERRQERRMSRLIREEIKWEPMIIPYISKTFVSGGIIHSERKILIEESIEETLENIHINDLNEVANEKRSLSLYINDVNGAATNSEFPLERNMCLEGSQDFEGDVDGGLSLDLLRMVE